MSGLYFEAHPSMSASRLTSEVALALQNKREAYVYCHPSDGDAVERLLKRPFVAQPDLSELISQQAKPQGETERIHTLIKPDPELLLYLLNTGVWDTRGLPKEKQPNGTFGARRRAPYEPPCHVTPEVIQQTCAQVTGVLNELLSLIKRDLWRWYARHVSLTRLTSEGREVFYFEIKESVYEQRAREIPF